MNESMKELILRFFNPGIFIQLFLKDTRAVLSISCIHGCGHECFVPLHMFELAVSQRELLI